MATALENALFDRRYHLRNPERYRRLAFATGARCLDRSPRTAAGRVRALM